MSLAKRMLELATNQPTAQITRLRQLLTTLGRDLDAAHLDAETAEQMRRTLYTAQQTLTELGATVEALECSAVF